LKEHRAEEQSAFWSKIQRLRGRHHLAAVDFTIPFWIVELRSRLDKKIV
jgi:hypothetical protein